MKIEYKVREVSKYIVTRYEETDEGRTGTSSKRGEFDNYQTAFDVAYAMASLEHEKLGYPPDDMRIIYPQSKAIKE